MNNSKEFVTKSFKLHKERDKRLIELLDAFVETKTLSTKVKEALELYFSLKEEERNEFYDRMAHIEKMVKELKSSGISIASYQSSPSRPTQPIVRESKSINELMNSVYEQSDDGIDLSL